MTRVDQGISVCSSLTICIQLEDCPLLPEKKLKRNRSQDSDAMDLGD